MQVSKKYFEDIGATVAQNKCFLSSSCPLTRGYMRDYRWDSAGSEVLVSNHFRDLGCHLCLDCTGAGSTTSNRLKEAIASTRRLKCLPLSKDDERREVQSNIIPAGLCCIEVTKGSRALLKELQAVIVDAIGPRSAKRAQMGVRRTRAIMSWTQRWCSW